LFGRMAIHRRSGSKLPHFKLGGRGDLGAGNALVMLAGFALGVAGLGGGEERRGMDGGDRTSGVKGNEDAVGQTHRKQKKRQKNGATPRPIRYIMLTAK
jgi:hypothetical protein